MANTFKVHHFHLIWSTFNRENLITNDIKAPLYAYIGGIIRKNQGVLVEINGIENHIHLLVGLDSLEKYTEMIRQIKGGSSAWVNKTKPLPRKFGWQKGYGSFCVSYSLIDAVRSYIQNQEQHHKKQTYEEEYLNFLELNRISYDKRYIFD